MLKTLIQTIREASEGLQDGDFDEQEFAQLFYNLAKLTASLIRFCPHWYQKSLLSGISAACEGLAYVFERGEEAIGDALKKFGNLLQGLGVFLNKEES